MLNRNQASAGCSSAAVLGIVCGLPSWGLIRGERLRAKIHALILGGVARMAWPEQARDPVGVQPLARRCVVGDHSDEER